MATQVIHALIIFVMCYVITGVVLIEIAMWLMKRLDHPTASAMVQRRGVEYEVGTTLPVQADVARTYPPGGSISVPMEVDEFPCPLTTEPLLQFFENFQEPYSDLRVRVDTAGELHPQIIFSDHEEDLSQILSLELQGHRQGKAHVPHIAHLSP